jgi:DNA mismatch repair protein MutL
MTQRIKELALDIINKIAAGEVVERPSSIVRELIENSLDAQSTELSVELVDAGKKYIAVKDNGEGINSDDITLALKRHATSKINSFEDLYAISTLGFRGEAIPAIASVSKMAIISKTKEVLSAVKIISEYGEIKSKTKKASSDGTAVIVEDLFSNVPARLKFLKKTATELQHCINIINNYAISYPGVSFKLVHNGRSLFFYPSTKDSKTRLQNVFNTKAKWFSANSSYEYINGEAFIIDPANTEHRNDIRLFVNGRFVRDRSISHAVASSFEKHLSTGTPPLSIIFLSIDPAFVDTNVSPTKSEVRFREQNLIYTFVQSLVEQALKQARPKTDTKTTQASAESFSYGQAWYNKDENKNYQSLTEPSEVQDIISGLYTPSSKRKILGQFRNQYIVLEEDASLVLIDQHAAHERINFEKTLNMMIQEPSSQSLLMPELIDLSSEQALLLEDIINELKQKGFEIEKFSDDKNKTSSFAIRAIPKALTGLDIKALVYDLLRTKFDHISRQTISKSIAMSAAKISCHDSVRGSSMLNLAEIDHLLDDLDKCEYPHTCPHGRPIKIELALDEIEKLFKRK